MSSPQRYALLSVTDKTGIADFAKNLVEIGFKIISTGGTSKLLRENHIEVIDAADFTGHPECLDGRVKTLHPKIHGGLLADRNNPSHLADMARLGFTPIDVVAVNLYDFAGQAAGKNLPVAKLIEHIDVGGPTMLRASAKNHAHIYVIVDPDDYDQVIHALSGSSQMNDAHLRRRLAKKVFEQTAKYDAMIAQELDCDQVSQTAVEASTPTPLALNLSLPLELRHALRYGENSHQIAGLYSIGNTRKGLCAANIIQGKELSYNNLVDLDAAAAIVADLAPVPAITIIKHTNPCGTAAKTGATARELFTIALSADPKCAFGGIVASNITIDEDAARGIAEIFLECVIAPKFTEAALKVLSAKKNLRVVESDIVLPTGQTDSWMLRSVAGGVLLQSPDRVKLDATTWRCVSKAVPSTTQLEELSFAMTLCRHVKSNAIVLTRNNQSIGIGAGQMSRVDSARIAIEKTRELSHSPRGAVAASDAFFPFRDTVDLLINAGISAIVHPGGSVRDQESIDAANEHGIVMMVSGLRHFKH